MDRIIIKSYGSVIFATEIVDYPIAGITNPNMVEVKGFAITQNKFVEPNWDVSDIKEITFTGNIISITTSSMNYVPVTGDFVWVRYNDTGVIYTKKFTVVSEDVFFTYTNENLYSFIDSKYNTITIKNQDWVSDGFLLADGTLYHIDDPDGDNTTDCIITNIQLMGSHTVINIKLRPNENLSLVDESLTTNFSISKRYGFPGLFGAGCSAIAKENTISFTNPDIVSEGIIKKGDHIRLFNTTDGLNDSSANTGSKLYEVVAEDPFLNAGESVIRIHNADLSNDLLEETKMPLDSYIEVDKIFNIPSLVGNITPRINRIRVNLLEIYDPLAIAWLNSLTKGDTVTVLGTDLNDGDYTYKQSELIEGVYFNIYFEEDLVYEVTSITSGSLTANSLEFVLDGIPIETTTISESLNIVYPENVVDVSAPFFTAGDIIDVYYYNGVTGALIVSGLVIEDSMFYDPKSFPSEVKLKFADRILTTLFPDGQTGYGYKISINKTFTYNSDLATFGSVYVDVDRIVLGKEISYIGVLDNDIFQIYSNSINVGQWKISNWDTTVPGITTLILDPIHTWLLKEESLSSSAQYYYSSTLTYNNTDGSSLAEANNIPKIVLSSQLYQDGLLKFVPGSIIQIEGMVANSDFNNVDLIIDTIGDDGTDTIITLVPNENWNYWSFVYEELTTAFILKTSNPATKMLTLTAEDGSGEDLTGFDGIIFSSQYQDRLSACIFKDVDMIVNNHQIKQIIPVEDTDDIGPQPLTMVITIAPGSSGLIIPGVEVTPDPAWIGNLSWNSVEDAVSYELIIDNALPVTTTDLFYSVTWAGSPSGVIHSWKIRAIGVDTVGPWSLLRRLQVIAGAV